MCQFCNNTTNPAVVRHVKRWLILGFCYTKMVRNGNALCTQSRYSPTALGGIYSMSSQSSSSMDSFTTAISGPSMLISLTSQCRPWLCGVSKLLLALLGTRICFLVELGRRSAPGVWRAVWDAESGSLAIFGPRVIGVTIGAPARLAKGVLSNRGRGGPCDVTRVCLERPWGNGPLNRRSGSRRASV
jgi:hypothetical protein